MKRYRILPVDLSRLHLTRAAVALVSALAWLAISNHCALASLVPAKPAAHAACHGDQPTAPTKHSGDEAPCCKVLRATVANAAKILPAQVCTTPAPFAVLAPPLLLPAHNSAETFTDTGPPGLSLGELILQRCVLTHAPPRFA